MPTTLLSYKKLTIFELSLIYRLEPLLGPRLATSRPRALSRRTSKLSMMDRQQSFVRVQEALLPRRKPSLAGSAPPIVLLEWTRRPLIIVTVHRLRRQLFWQMDEQDYLQTSIPFWEPKNWPALASQGLSASEKTNMPIEMLFRTELKR